MPKPQPESRDQDLVRLYLDEIGRHPLLTKDDEVRLSRLVETGREARARLDRGPPRAPAPRRGRRDDVAAGDDATRTFTNANLRLVVSIAKRYQSADMPLLDLIQEGNLGLIHAVEKFDWRRGFKFSTYATWWIRQSIGRGIDNGSRTIRLPVHAADQVRRLQRARADLESVLGRSPTLHELGDELGLSLRQVSELLQQAADPVSLAAPIGEEGDSELADVVADRSALTPFDVVAADLLKTEVERLLSPLDAREREVLRLRFGLDRGDPRTLDDVGDVLQLTRERIRQIEKSALDKLRTASLDTEVRELLAS